MDNKCKYCNNLYNNLSQHNKSCKEYKKYVNSINYDILCDLYINKQMCSEDIKNYLGFTHQSIVNRLLKKFNISKRSLKETASSENRKNKSKKTHLERYGVEHNFSKNSISRKIWEEKLLKEEGITNVFQRESVKDKIKKTLFEKYNVYHPMHSNEFKDKLLATRLKNGTQFTGFIKYSTIHRMVVDFLNSNNILNKIEFYIKKDLFGYYFYDIKIEGSNKLIEINGDYWHCNPIKYKENDIIKMRNNEYLVKDIWKIDKQKNEFALKNGYKLLIIWEYDLINFKVQTLNKILEYAKDQN